MVEGELRSGTKLPAILLLNAEGGKNWEVWRTGVNQGDNRDAIGVERMDLGNHTRERVCSDPDCVSARVGAPP
jgi:hypothetical protein